MNEKTQRELPERLRKLPSFEFTRDSGTARQQAEHPDVAYGIESLDEVVAEAVKRFNIPRRVP